jgi:hypothetical protein
MSAQPHVSLVSWNVKTSSLVVVRRIPCFRLTEAPRWVKLGARLQGTPPFTGGASINFLVKDHTLLDPATILLGAT